MKHYVLDNENGIENISSEINDYDFEDVVKRSSFEILYHIVPKWNCKLQNKKQWLANKSKKGTSKFIRLLIPTIS